MATKTTVVCDRCKGDAEPGAGSGQVRTQNIGNHPAQLDLCPKCVEAFQGFMNIAKLASPPVEGVPSPQGGGVQS